MSLLSFIKAQLGLSNTPANNFVLDASANNGTMKLARGNAGATTQDIMTVASDGKVTFPQNGVNLRAKTFSVTTPSSATPTSFAHGLTASKIRSVSIVITLDTNEYIGEEYSGSSSTRIFALSIVWNATNIYMVPSANATSGIFSKAAVITVLYED